MDQYTITGMSCAACSARVEKAVLQVPGVSKCSVNLLTNSSNSRLPPQAKRRRLRTGKRLRSSEGLPYRLRWCSC